MACFHLLRPTASISSINIIEGAEAFAYLNSCLTLDAPTPTNFYTNSLPLVEKNATLAYPAHAFANNVFPVPGGPVNKAPLGILAPNLLNFSGCLRN